MTHVFFHWQPVLQTAGQGHFISIFQFAAKGNTSGNGGNIAMEVLQFFLNIVYGSIALYIWA